MYRCPNCKSKNVIPIVYGYPSMDTVEMAERYEIKLGGCVVYADREMPDLYCKDCKKEWSVDDLTDRDITKIRFVIETCGPEPLEDHIKWVYEVFPNGACRYYEYKGYSRSSKEKKHFDIPSSEAMKLIHLLREYTYKKDPHETSAMNKIMTWWGIQMKAMNDKSNSNLSELLLNGTNMGIIEGRRLLNQNPNINKDIHTLLGDFVKMQEDSVERLKCYL